MRRKNSRLTYEERVKIEELLKKPVTIIQIANLIGIHIDTVYKEIQRCLSEEDYKKAIGISIQRFRHNVELV